METRPNILVVLCDQLRRSALRCSGDPNVSTPNIDQLAEQGVRFTNSCSSYPICVPTRFTFMTGEYAHTRFVPSIDWRMSPAEHTIAHELGAAGYQTAYIGKWHLAGFHRYVYNEDAEERGKRARRQNRMPIRKELRGGFEHWRGFEFRNDPFDTFYFSDDDPTPRRIDGYQTDGLFDLAEEYIDDQWDGTAPFFQVLSVEAPHPPFTAPREDLERWNDREMELAPNVDLDTQYPVRDWGVEEIRDELGMNDGILDDIRAYYAMIENLDRNIGELLDVLERKGLRKTTAILFLSDHGELLGSHGLIEKEHPYEESIGVPFILSHVGGDINQNVTIDEPIATEDWFPTVCGLAGIDLERQNGGADLTPLMRGERNSLDRPGVMLEFVREHRGGSSSGESIPFNRETWRGFRTRRYKYTVKGGPQGGEPWQLFDLQADRYETENLIEDPDYRATAGKLHGHLRDRIDATNDDFGLKPAFGHDGINYWEA